MITVQNEKVHVCMPFAKQAVCRGPFIDILAETTFIPLHLEVELSQWR